MRIMGIITYCDVGGEFSTHEAEKVHFKEDQFLLLKPWDEGRKPPNR